MVPHRRTKYRTKAIDQAHTSTPRCSRSRTVAQCFYSWAFFYGDFLTKCFYARSPVRTCRCAHTAVENKIETNNCHGPRPTACKFCLFFFRFVFVLRCRVCLSLLAAAALRVVSRAHTCPHGFSHMPPRPSHRPFPVLGACGALPCFPERRDTLAHHQDRMKNPRSGASARRCFSTCEQK